MQKMTLGRLAKELGMPMKDLKRLAKKRGLTVKPDRTQTPLYDQSQAEAIAQAAGKVRKPHP